MPFIPRMRWRTPLVINVPQWDRLAASPKRWVSLSMYQRRRLSVSPLSLALEQYGFHILGGVDRLRADRNDHVGLQIAAALNLTIAINVNSRSEDDFIGTVPKPRRQAEAHIHIGRFQRLSSTSALTS